MYTQFEAICNSLFSFWGQKLCCWQVYLHNLAQSMRWSHHTDGWVPEWGWGIDNDARKVCVCVWERERERERERNHNTIWLLLGSGTDLYFCLGGAHQKWWDASNTKVTACYLHEEGHQEVETQVRLEPGYPYWVFPSLWGNHWWSEQTRLCCADALSFCDCHHRSWKHTLHISIVNKYILVGLIKEQHCDIS